MKQKVILVSFIALIFALSTVMALNFAEIDEVEVNDVSIGGSIIGMDRISVGHVSDTVPVEVEFTALKDVDESVKVKVYIERYKNEIYDSVILRTPLKEGVVYRERFSLELPSSMDLDELSEDLTLLVRFIAKGEDSFDVPYTIRMQRDIHSLNILSIDAPGKVTSGSVVAFDVVLQNNGNNRLENVYAKASIPELGVESLRAYFGDIDPQDESEIEYIDDPRDLDREDTASKRIYLSIPRNLMPGVYSIEIEAYNYDTSTTEGIKVIISDVETGILPTQTSRAISIGEETSFEILLVNPSDKMVVYSLMPEESEGLIIDISKPIVAVSAGSSETVQVKVKATQSAEEGTHLITVNVNSETGLVRQVNFSVNVEEDTARKANSVLILTVILAIVFIVLLIILIVLLTKKPSEIEEFGEEGETSYY